MDELLMFRFEAINNKQKAHPTRYRVVTDNFNMMNLFLKQHCFNDITPESLSVVKFADVNKCPDRYNILQPYMFKSNYNDKIYTIITSEGFVNYAIDAVANDLNNYMVFGEAILRNDIAVFKTIGNIIYELPHTHIFDYILANEESVDNPGSLIDSDLLDMRRCYLSAMSAPCEDPGSYMTFESLHDAVNTDEIMPITIECYTSSFVEMMTDEYC